MFYSLEETKWEHGAGWDQNYVFSWNTFAKITPNGMLWIGFNHVLYVGKLSTKGSKKTAWVIGFVQNFGRSIYTEWTSSKDSRKE